MDGFFSMLITACTVFGLIFFEAALSFDNAFALAAIARGVPLAQRSKVLTYGVAGAFFFRLLALCCLTLLIKYPAIRFVAGCYLLYLAAAHFIEDGALDGMPQALSPRQFWGTILLVELTDISLSFDSVFGALALSESFWVLFAGAVLGIVLMRFAAGLLVPIFERIPWLQHAAYGLIAASGLQMVWAGLKMAGI